MQRPENIDTSAGHCPLLTGTNPLSSATGLYYSRGLWSMQIISLSILETSPKFHFTYYHTVQLFNIIVSNDYLLFKTLEKLTIKSLSCCTHKFYFFQLFREIVKNNVLFKEHNKMI